MEQPKPIYVEQGYVYPEGKIAGKRVVLQFWPSELHVYGGSIAGQIGKQFGAIGGVIGGVIDTASSGNQAAKGPSMVVPYLEITTMQISKSLLNGKGIMITTSSGSKFKIATLSMSYSFKKVYPEIVRIARQSNPDMVADSL